MKIIKLKNNIFLKILGGILTPVFLFYSFPPYNFYYFSFFAFIPLFFSTSNIYKNFFYGLISGFIFYSLTLFWLKNVSGYIYLLLALYLSLYWAIFLSLTFSFDIKKIILVGASIWFFLEIIMNYLFTGFPWCNLALTQCNNYLILKIAKISGTYGISFFIMGINLFLFTILKKIFSLQQIFFIFIFMLFLFFSDFKTQKIEKGYLKVLMIQPNFSVKDIDIEKNKLEIFSILKNELQKFPDTNIVVLPEGSFQDNIFKHKEFLNKLKKLSKIYNCGIIIGCFSGDSDGKVYNSSLFINGENVDVYNKVHLVPYGEFILGERFEFVKKIFLKIAGYAPMIKKGTSYIVFNYNSIKFATPICYENIFPEISETFIKKDCDFFIVITNDGWFGNSAGPFQHFYHNILRSIETGRYFLQVSLTGITGVVNPDGKVVEILKKENEKLFFKGSLSHPLKVEVYKTFYSIYGIFPFLIFTIFLLGVILCKR